MSRDLNKGLAIAVSDLIEANQTTADIGIILGCLGKDSIKWLKDLKKECLTVDEFIEAARQRADIALVAAAVEAALGYNYEEVDQDYIRIPAGYDDLGSPVMREIPGNKRIKTRHAKKNDALLKFILKNRLPEYFQDVQKVEINKQSIEIKAITESEIKSFAGRLLNAIEDDKMEAITVEVNTEPSTEKKD